MNDVEFNAIMAYYQARFDRELPPGTQLIWHESLLNFGFEETKETIQRLGDRDYPPHIGQIEREIARASVDRPSKEDAWNEALYFVQRYGVYAKPEDLTFSHPAVARAIESVGFINICNSDQGDDYFLKRFYETYESIGERMEKEVVQDTVRKELAPEQQRELGGQR